jgi:hypothetical protein
MPRIADKFTDCAVFIYRSIADAKCGEHQGGSGFIVMLPMETNPNLAHTYIVTNRHVVQKARNPVVRLNRRDGRTTCLETMGQDWYFHPDGDDIAVLGFEAEEQDLKHIPLPINIFVTRSLVEDEDIGIGDDTVMVGRFINHEGKQQNTPAVRFGNIAMMAEERIKNRESGIDQESFLIEVRSLPGYSGSAVFIYSPCASNDMSVRRYGIEKQSVEGYNKRSPDEWRALYSPKGPYLLGIDWCHIPRTAHVTHKDESPTEWVVSENTGMAGVIPAWKIAELLNLEELQENRRDAEKQIADTGVS